MLQYVVALLVGAACITRVEYTARTVTTFSDQMMMAWPFILGAQFCLFHVFSRGPSLMAAWLGWTITMSLMRVASSYFLLDEGLDMRFVCLAVLLMLFGAVAMKQA